jgi:hypothetical protein
MMPVRAPLAEQFRGQEVPRLKLDKHCTSWPSCLMITTLCVDGLLPLKYGVGNVSGSTRGACSPVALSRDADNQGLAGYLLGMRTGICRMSVGPFYYLLSNVLTINSSVRSLCGVTGFSQAPDVLLESLMLHFL